MSCNKLYHIQIYVPTDLIVESLQHQKNIDDVIISQHYVRDHINNPDKKHLATREQLSTGLKMIKECPVVPFEYEEVDGKLFKYALRTEFDKYNDMIIVIQINKTGLPLIRTSYINNKNDRHFTLDESKYAKRPY